MELIREVESPMYGNMGKKVSSGIHRLFWWREPSAFIIDGSGQEEDSFSLGVLWKPLIKTLDESILNPVQDTQQAYNRKFKKVCR